jgi:hypothetical protein
VTKTTNIRVQQEGVIEMSFQVCTVNNNIIKDPQTHSSHHHHHHNQDWPSSSSPFSSSIVVEQGWSSSSSCSSSSSSSVVVEEQQHQYQERPRVVRFCPSIVITEIESAKESYTQDEKNAAWYTGDEMGRFRKRSTQLVKHMSDLGGTDEELFNLWGIQSNTTVKAKKRSIRAVQKCIRLLTELSDHKIATPVERRKVHDLLMQVYNFESASSAKRAHIFALMVRNQSYDSVESNTSASPVAHRRRSSLSSSSFHRW